MTPSALEKVMGRLKFSLDAFAMCEIGQGSGLRVAAQEMILVHFVLQGRGSIEWADGKLDLEPGSIAIIPSNLAKVINGPGPIVRVIQANDQCRLSEGIIKFAAKGGQDCLLLGCGALDSAALIGVGLFDQLTQPVAVTSSDPTLPLLFSVILAELSRPEVGSKSIVEAAMAQILVIMIRSQLRQVGPLSSFVLNLEGAAGLSHAVERMRTRPQDDHHLDQLAQTAGMSRSRFSRDFNDRFGQSPIQYLRSVRLERAARLLEDTSDPVKVIAAAVGFSSRSQFSAAFRNTFGTDPTEFRRHSRPR